MQNFHSMFGYFSTLYMKGLRRKFNTNRLTNFNVSGTLSYISVTLNRYFDDDILILISIFPVYIRAKLYLVVKTFLWFDTIVVTKYYYDFFCLFLGKVYYFLLFLLTFFGESWRRKGLGCWLIKGNVQLFQKVTFEPSMDFKQSLWKYYENCYF